MIIPAQSLLATLTFVSLALAHGWIGKVTIGSKSYLGNPPALYSTNPPPSVIRQIADVPPVKDVCSADLTCGTQATPAALQAPAAPGDPISVEWHTLAGAGYWFHDVGPLMVYLASCAGVASCAELDSSETTAAEWFKIDEQGRDGNGIWAQDKLDAGAPASFVLPQTLKSGHYLLRHEIIALHTAQYVGGAEFYVGCVQLNVTGHEEGAPNAKAGELVRIPGAYTPTDSGILIDVYDLLPSDAYPFPGPPVAALVSHAESGGASTSTQGKIRTTLPGVQTTEKPTAAKTTTSVKG
ncbi:glycoside hydrolase [Roridomyces roridus]|uniref:lytic cellulose monooxygenase (C4-dehydrogenating) n=1 Tax=Roridomyces roridus TaxID=1738132 RepID=A0AAD7C0V4_9AGAR|nr:glycoside hydrolase [Roridomyces roridus]